MLFKHLIFNSSVTWTATSDDFHFTNTSSASCIMDRKLYTRRTISCISCKQIMLDFFIQYDFNYRSLLFSWLVSSIKPGSHRYQSLSGLLNSTNVLQIPVCPKNNETIISIPISYKQNNDKRTQAKSDVLSSSTKNSFF